MACHQPRLLRKNSVYYFRGVIPEKLKSVAKKGEIKYSLNTTNRREALTKCRKYSYMFDLYLERLRMRLNNDNSLDLDDNDLNAIKLGRLDEIEQERRRFFKFDETAPENEIGLFNYNKFNQWIDEDPEFPERVSQLNERLVKTDDGYETIPGLTTSSPEFQEEVIVEWFKKYLAKTIENDEELSIENKYILQGIIENKIKLKLFFNGKKSALAKLSQEIKPLEEYAIKKAKAEYSKTPYTPPEGIQILLEALKQQKINKISQSKIGQKTEKTHWMTIWEKIKEQKINKNQNPKSLFISETRLKRIFSLIGKEFLDDITADDCDTINSQLYHQPWGLNKKPMANKTIVGYIMIFKEIMREGHKRNKNIIDVRDLILAPTQTMVLKTKMERKNFEVSDLTKIFDTDSFRKLRYDDVNFPKFWVPLIALYSGCRLNEICQLEIDNIKTEAKIPIMVITDTGFNQHLKNQQSKRIVPIHNKLIELGFLEFVEKIKKAKKYRKQWVSRASKKLRATRTGKYKPVYNPDGLFFTLTYTVGNGYAGKITKWFNPLLKKLGIQYSKNSLNSSLEKLVFHSFRHTSSSNLSDHEVSDTQIDSICGWKTDGMRGNYVHLAINKKKEAIDRISYKKFEKTTFKKLLTDPKKEKNFLKI